MIRKRTRNVSAAAILLVAGAFTTTASACTPDGYIGTMTVFGGNFAIRGCAIAQGQLVQISQNTALFSILGTTYGGDGRIDFALPDARGRSLIGQGSGPGLSNILLGQKGGAETVTLIVNNLPAHSHTASASVSGGGFEALLNAYMPAQGKGKNTEGTDQYINATTATTFSDEVPNVTLSPMSIDLQSSGSGDPGVIVTVGETGDSLPFNIRDPFLGVNWLIQLQGVFPSRN